MPAEFMGIAFGASLDSVLEVTKQLECNPLEPDEAEGYEVLVCYTTVSQMVIGFFFKEDNDRLSFAGGLHSTSYSDSIMAEAPFMTILRARIEEFGKPDEVLNSPTKAKAIWGDGKAVAFVLLDLEDEDRQVVYIAVTRQLWDLRF